MHFVTPVRVPGVFLAALTAVCACAMHVDEQQPDRSNFYFDPSPFPSTRALVSPCVECAASLERVTKRAVKREQEAQRRERVAVEMEANAMRQLQLAAEERQQRRPQYQVRIQVKEQQAAGSKLAAS